MSTDKKNHLCLVLKWYLPQTHTVCLFSYQTREYLDEQCLTGVCPLLFLYVFVYFHLLVKFTKIAQI